MKPHGRHPINALSALRVRTLKRPGKYADGNGLYAVVDASGAKRWLLRTVVHGRRRDLGLGSVSLVSLAEAREQAAAYRKVARAGGDPVVARRKALAIVPTFEAAAELVHADHKTSWRNEKHAQQWINTLRQYAFPSLREVPLDQIDTPEILKVLSPIWLTKPETARRVRQRIGTVLDWAKTAGYRTGENPIAGIAKGLPKQNSRNKHFAALPYEKVPEFMAALRQSENNEIVRLGLELLILTAARTNEVINAVWDEFDLPGGIWTIPAARMKAKREHRVPLGKRSIEVLIRAKELSATSDFAFPGRSLHRPLSNMAFSMLLRRMQVRATVHGFRSSFRDWAAERTSVPREVAEMALAHTISNKAEAAYRRGDLFEKRQALMSLWSTFLCEGRK